jgi:hypothetical protein
MRVRVPLDNRSTLPSDRRQKGPIDLKLEAVGASLPDRTTS